MIAAAGSSHLIPNLNWLLSSSHSLRKGMSWGFLLMIVLSLVIFSVLSVCAVVKLATVPRSLLMQIASFLSSSSVGSDFIYCFTLEADDTL